MVLDTDRSLRGHLQSLEIPLSVCVYIYTVRENLNRIIEIVYFNHFADKLMFNYQEQVFV